MKRNSSATLVFLGSLAALTGLAACGDDDVNGSTLTTGPTTSATTTGNGGSGSTGGGATTGSGAAGGAGQGGDATGGGGGSTQNLSPGCNGAQPLTEGEHTFMLGGLSRKYMLRLPANYDNTAGWPLVLALHGNGGSISYWDVTDGARNIRGVLENEAVLIIAEAIDNQWRDYGMPSSTWPARIDQELEYFDQVINEAKDNLCIDQDKIHSMGFSGGGSFSGVLGCRRTDIRGIAVGGSVIYFDENNCINTPAAWITIGTGELEPPREAYRDFFRDRAMCMSSTTATNPAPCEAYDGCNAATPVHYCQHPDGHIWPDFGSAAMWDFLKAL